MEELYSKADVMQAIVAVLLFGEDIGYAAQTARAERTSTRNRARTCTRDAPHRWPSPSSPPICSARRIRSCGTAPSTFPVASAVRTSTSPTSSRTSGRR